MRFDRWGAKMNWANSQRPTLMSAPDYVPLSTCQLARISRESQHLRARFGLELRFLLLAVQVKDPGKQNFKR